MFIELTLPGPNPRCVYVAIGHITSLQRAGKFTEVRCIASGGENGTVYMAMETPEQILAQIEGKAAK